MPPHHHYCALVNYGEEGQEHVMMCLILFNLVFVLQNDKRGWCIAIMGMCLFGFRRIGRWEN
jgi:hypothetical protein